MNALKLCAYIESDVFTVQYSKYIYTGCLHGEMMCIA